MGGVRWYKVSLQVPSVPPNGIAKGPMVEFVFTDGGDAWNKPAGMCVLGCLGGILYGGGWGGWGGL